MFANDQSNSMGENDSSGESSGPFKATQLWKKLIIGLKTNVTVKKKRGSAGQSESVFNGQNAVDVIYTCLVDERSKGSSSLITKHVTRNVANRVCQALLDSRVFAPLTTSKNLSETPKNHVFTDDESNFYYFTNVDDFIFPSPALFKVDNDTHKHNGRKTLPFSSRHLSLVRCRRLLSSDRLENSSDASDTDLARKEVAFRHLLSLIELPFLEDLIPVYELIEPNCNVEKLLDDSTISTSDSWVAMVKELTDSSCVYYDNPVGLSNEQLKRQEYLKLRHHYRNHPSAIVSTQYNEIFVAILGFMKRKDFTKALQATQYAILLLPYNRRKTLQILLKFMGFVTREDFKLENDIENEQLVLDHFASSIFDIKLMASAEILVLTHFLLLNQKPIFVVPNVINQELSNYKHENTFLGQDSLFCQQIPESIYKDQTHKESNAAIEKLMESIIDSTTISLKEKQKFLKRFKKHHPEIYDKCLK
ncbi:DEP domain containing [Chamberlinius hualienensis]